MVLLRALVLMALLAATAPPVTAQEGTATPATPATINPVEAAITADHPSLCDDIGRSALPDEFEKNTIDIARQGVCHHGVGAFLLGACIEPFEDDDVDEGGPRPGEAHVFCTVLVMHTEDAGEVVIDPKDFMIIDKQDRRFTIDRILQADIPVDRRLSLTRLQPGGSVSGKLSFVVDAPLAQPFLLAWKPSRPANQSLAAIVVDRTVPWEDAGRI